MAIAEHHPDEVSAKNRGVLKMSHQQLHDFASTKGLTNEHVRKGQKMSTKHIGFKGAQEKVEREGFSKKVAGAIIASRTRHASAAAKKENPRLKKVK